MIALAVLALLPVTMPQAPMVFRPPTVPPNCRATLKSLGARFKPWRNPRRILRGKVVCHAPQGVRLYRGRTGLDFRGPKVNCAMALRLMTFEKVLQEEAMRAFREPVKRISMWGSYQCRRMANYPTWVSEHSFGNAIDLGGVVLKSGKVITVLKDFVKKGRPMTAKGRFWNRLAKRLYREKVFSVVLTPNFDKLHHNHLHLDGAPYTADGT